MPEIVARTWAAAKREGEDEITEREVTALLADFATVWSELFPAEQARVVQLLVVRVDVHEDALEVRIRAEGLVSLVCPHRQRRGMVDRDCCGVVQLLSTEPPFVTRTRHASNGRRALRAQSTGNFPRPGPSETMQQQSPSLLR